MLTSDSISSDLGARREMAEKLIADLRKRLLDLSNRNRLLNFKFSERARTHVRIVDEIPDVLYSKLSDGKKLTFIPLPNPEDEPEDEQSDEFFLAVQAARMSDEEYLRALDGLGEEDEPSTSEQKIERALKDRVRQQLGLPPRSTRDSITPADYARANGICPSYDLPRDGGSNKPAHVDDYIQTLLFPDHLERKLSGIRDGARIALSEMGVNLLYTVLGYLEWYESEASDVKFFAPLLLQPLVMERTLVRQTYRYSIASTGDDSEINLTLKERLLRDFGLVLPDLGEKDTPESYFIKTEEAIREMKRWRVRRFATVGLFSFNRLVMYHDLDPERWPEQKALHLHSVLVELLGGSNRGQAMYADDYEVDQPEIAAKVPLLITDADGSQFSAIADVMDGKNLAIKGPPGTGKSQTITNIIAAALARGQKVLFVAEKMAALEVVKKRLDEAGLGEFCLELHSTKAQKKDVLDSLRKRLELQPSPGPAELERTIAEHDRYRHQLTRYVELVNRSFGHSGRSIQQLFWGGIRATDYARGLGLPPALNEVELLDAVELTTVDLDRHRTALAALEQLSSSFTEIHGTPTNHPWAGMHQADLSPFEQEALVRALETWREAILALEKKAKQIASDLALLGLTTVGDLCSLLEAITLLPENPDDIVGDMLPKLQSEEALTALDKFLGIVRNSEDLIRALCSNFDDAVNCLPQAHVVHSLDAARGTLMVGGRIFAGQVGELRMLATRYRELARLVAAWIATSRYLFQALGMNLTLTPLNLETILDAIDVLRSMPRECLLRRSATLIDQVVRPVLERAAEEAQSLNKRQRELAESFSFSPDDNPQEYRRFAAALRRASLLDRILLRTGVFGWLADAEFKRARRVWHGTRRDRTEVTLEEMAQDFEQLAEHLEAIEKFHMNDRLRVICGKEFDGLATDFDGLLGVHDFVCEVKRKFPGDAPSHREARRLLLECDIVTLDAVLGEAHAGTLAELRSFFSVLKEEIANVPVDLELDEARQAYLKVAEAADTLHLALKGIGLKNEYTMESLPALAGEIERFAQLKEAIEGNETIKDFLGVHFRGIDTDWIRLGRTIQFVRDLQAKALPTHLIGWLFQDNLTQKLGQLKELAAPLKAALTHEITARDRALQTSAIDCQRFFGTNSLDKALLATTVTRIERALEARDQLPAWIEYSRQRLEVEEMGLRPVLEAYEAISVPFAHLIAAFEHVYHRAVLSQAYKQHPDLQRFGGMSQETARRRFQDLDRMMIDLKRRQLVAELACAPISEGRHWGPIKERTQLSLVLHQLSLQRRHIAVRDLLLRAGTAIQEMKPCWMMSPASIAQFIHPGGTEFDLVVIDEASQMRPEEALGAIGRGRQLIVVGDPHQLPPTSFFERIDIPGEDEDEDYLDTESILDLALAVFHPARELRWHYRSRHESLIAFSNKHFYEGRLVVFPSPTPDHADYGIEYHNVQGLYTPKASVNLLEAQAVAEATLQFMATHPDRSLGIATINQAQREILSEEMDRIFARDRRAEAYRAHWEKTLEPFFVKNLENVQGDERDVIFISTVYGPEQRGGRVAQRFGPINSAAGHRRLNVLFTRAKEKVMVFSSMQPSDVLPTESSRRGVKILKDYLDYAISGRLDPGAPTGRDPDSDFEVFVANRLRREGFEVVSQVGVAGYFIDLAVKDPGDSHRYLLGIECDGATYHTGRSARDRDRLRQEILERKGWKLYRIWSTDWFSHPDREVVKLTHYIRELIGS